MTTYLHHPTGLDPNRRYRVDLDALSGTVATVTRVDPLTQIAGSVLQADGAGAVAAFLGTAATLYLRPLSYLGAAGTAVTSTGAVYPVPYDASAGGQPADPDLTTIAALDATQGGVMASDGAGWLRKPYAAIKTALSLAATDVGLGNVNNTSDAGKPISTATQAALNGITPLSLGARQRPTCVANRSIVPITQSSSGSGQFVRWLYNASEDITSLQIICPNWFAAAAAPDEYPCDNGITVRAYIEPLAGWWKYTSNSTAWSSATAYAVGNQVTRSGTNYVAVAASTNSTPSTSSVTPWVATMPQLLPFRGAAATGEVTINPGETATSEPFAVFIPKGQRFAISVLVVPAGGTGKIPLGLDALVAGTSSNPDWVKAGATDYGATPPTATLSDSTAQSYRPIAVIGETGGLRKRCVALIGDSIMYGLGDGYSAILPEVPSFGARAMFDNGISYLRIARAGELASQWVDGRQRAHRRLALLRNVSHALLQHGVNDITTGNTLAFIQQTMIELWRQVGSVVPAWQTLITPKTTSTDSWATVGNQTASSGFGASSVWSGLNAWLADGGPINSSTLAAQAVGATGAGIVRAGDAGHPLKGVIDVATAVCDTVTTWAWKAGYTADGTHPTPTASAAMAAAINTAIFT